MSLKTHKFARKPFYVDAVRISETNFEEVAEWCKGEIKTDDDGVKFIQVEVHRPISDRQSQAYVGDWVLFAGKGFKVYMPKAFDRSFEKVKHLSKEQADAAGIKVPHEKSQPPKRRVPPALTQPVLSREQADRLNDAAEEPIDLSRPEPPKAEGDVKKPFEVKTEEQRQQEEADRLLAEVEELKRA